MLGEGYISKQIYIYQDLENLEQILKVTNTTKYFIHKEENVIEYTIDRKVQIRLSDLIYWIQEGLIKFHIGQLLDLYEKILLYVQFLESSNIEHEYLDSNRIWLVLQNESRFLNVVHGFLDYEIAFTGYQCPLYESNESQTKASEKICRLLFSITMGFINNKVWLIRDQKGIEYIKKIYQNLIDSFSEYSIVKSIKQIQEIKIHYKYQQESQMIYIDKKISEYSLKFIRQQEFRNELRNLFNSFHCQSQLLLEYSLKSLIPLYTKSLDNFKDSFLDSFPKINPKNQENFQQEMKSQDNEIHKATRNCIIAGVAKQIKKSEANFKFTFSENDIQEIENDIIYELGHKKLLKYFENSIWYQNEDTASIKACLAMKFIQDLINERFNLKQHMTILNLNYGLL